MGVHKDLLVDRDSDQVFDRNPAVVVVVDRDSMMRMGFENLYKTVFIFLALIKMKTNLKIGVEVVVDHLDNQQVDWSFGKDSVDSQYFLKSPQIDKISLLSKLR